MQFCEAILAVGDGAFIEPQREQPVAIRGPLPG
jgi:hypothetical protein